MSVAPAHRLSEPVPAAAPGVTVSRVTTKADRDAFIRFPFELYKGDPHWVPPLLMEREDFLNPKKNPWYEFGQADLYLAHRDGKVVGRIAAVNDPHYNEFHGTKLGFFGLFECVDDAGVARLLFTEAEKAARARGFEKVLGPVNFSTNYECSVLVDGFDSSPCVMMAYNPRYYAALYEACGFTKAKDLWAWELASNAPVPEKVARIADKIRQREGIVVRPVRMNDFKGEVARLKEIYNAAWEKNWGFVPMTDKEFEHICKEMKPLVRAELLLIAEVKGEPVAFSMTIPDANHAIKAANGKLTTFGVPVGLAKLLLASRQIKRLRLVTLGIKAGYRRRGLDAILYLDTIRTAAKLGYVGGEISWTLEDNDLVNRAIESMGGKRSKTYRLYGKDV